MCVDQPSAASAPEAVSRRSDSAGVQAAIARAKYEWECTADALPHLICLLDAQGRVLRANRVVERWELGSITDVLGRDLHGLLHASCASEPCELEDSLLAAWESLRAGEPGEFEIRDARLGRALHVSLRRMTPRTNAAATSSDSLAVAVVADVTELHFAQEAVNAMNRELESRVRLRTDALADANRDLQNEVVRRESAEDALRRSRNELALLSRQLMTAQEVERKRIARELHDSVGQALSAIKYTLERGAELAHQSRLRDPQPMLHRAVASLQDAIEEIRSIAMNLRPSVLDDLGAVSAVSWFCREFAQSYPGIELQEELSVVDSEVPERLSTAVFRSLQELLNNVAKHAHAHRVVVSLSRASGQLVLEVVDDGVGIAVPMHDPSVRSGRGIPNLRERAEMTGGQFVLTAGCDGKGTRARIEWRLSPGELSDSDAA